MSDQEINTPTKKEIESAGAASIQEYYANRFIASIANGEAVIALGSKTPFSPDVHYVARVFMIEDTIRSLHQALGGMLSDLDAQRGLTPS